MAKFTDALKFWSKPLTRGVRAITGNLDEQEEGQLRQEQERLFQSILNTTQPFRMGANTFAQNYGPAFRALTGGDPLTPGPVEQFTREALTPEEQDYLERKPYMAALKSSAGMASTLAPFASQGLRTAQLAANPLANRIAQLASQGALEGSLGGFGYSREGREVQDTLTGGLVGAGGELFMDYLTNPQFRKMLTDATTTVNPQTGARMYKGELGFNEDVLDTLNPTGGLTADYTPDTRVKARLGENITTLDKTMGRSADEMITVYRGASNSQGKISPGDFITTNEQLARDYAGTGRVIKERVRLGDILDDLTEPLGEEYIYRPMTGISTIDPLDTLKQEARKYKSAEEFVSQFEKHGGEAIEGRLIRGDADAIWSTDNDNYINQLMAIKRNGKFKTYQVYLGDKKIADLTDTSFIQGLRNKVGTKYGNNKTLSEGAVNALSKKDGQWAGWTYYKDLFKDLGYDGVRVFESDGTKSTGVFADSLTANDKILTKEQLADIWKQAQENLK